MRLWELTAGARTVGHARWVTGAELFVAAPWPLPRQVQSWFADPRVARTVVAPDEVDAFFAHELPERLGVRSVPIDLRSMPRPALWLATLDGDRIPKLGERDPSGWRSNRWAPEFDLAWLLHHTATGAVRWARAEHLGFKAGGRCPDSSEMWLSLHGGRRGYTLAIRRRRELWARPVRQSAGWFSRSTLQRLHGLLEGRL